MISTQTMMQLFSHYQEPKVDSDGVTYRMRKKDEETLELAKLIPSTCSCSMYHPRILVDISTEEAVAIRFYDNVAVPIVHVELAHASETEERFLDKQLEELTAEFTALSV